MTYYYLPQYKTSALNVPGGIDNSQTTGIILTDVSNVDTAKPGIVAITYSVPLDNTKVEFVSYTSINGSKELVGVTRGIDSFSAKSHNDGAIVAFVISASHINELATGILALESDWAVEHNSDGTHKDSVVVTLTGTQTLTNKTFTTPVINGAVTGTMTPPLTFYASNFNAPEGFLLNGKIVPSVASNNLTVAIKGMDGNDPSASNPVYIRIGDTVRAITSALSVTKNAGTNWCNAGSSELATKEIDYFVYIGYNATDGVVVGFSRIPYANSYDDFSTTTTNEKYAAISTITNVAATDYYTVVGRFAATLSAGAGYTWTVPTFTAKNLIQRPIFTTRQLSYTPTTTATTGSYTSVATVGFYRVRDDMCHIRTVTTVTTIGTAAGNTRITTPFSKTGTRGTAITGYEATSTGEAVSAAFGTDADNAIVYRKYTGAFFGANGYNVCCDGWFHLAE